MVGVTVCRLYLVGVEAGGKEQHVLAVGGFQDMVDIGGDAGSARQRAERGRLQNGEVSVASLRLDYRRDLARVAAVGRNGSVVNGAHFQLVERVYPVAARVEIAGAGLEHRQRLVHAHDDGEGTAAREPLHLDLDVADVYIGKVYANVGQVGGSAAEAVALPGEFGQHGGDIVEILIRVPAPAHPRDVQFERADRQAFAVEDAHALPLSPFPRSPALFRRSGNYSTFGVRRSETGRGLPPQRFVLNRVGPGSLRRGRLPPVGTLIGRVAFSQRRQRNHGVAFPLDAVSRARDRLL